MTTTSTWVGSPDAVGLSDVALSDVGTTPSLPPGPPGGDLSAVAGETARVTGRRTSLRHPSPYRPPGTLSAVRGPVSPEELQGVDGRPVDPDLEVEVGTGRVARAADVADELAAPDRAARHGEGRRVGVGRHPTVAVIDEAQLRTLLGEQ